ncbi:MAG: ABC transporter ATP-binding protein [Oscillospiraceae bacterium]|nr:ABC transporter ATP-binding protein [Oscillospiraceae bacterium]
MGQKAKDGTLKGVWEDWKWIWSFSRRRKGAVVLYTLCGILSSVWGLAAGVLSKYMIDSIIALDMNRLLPYCVLTVISAALGVVFQSLTSRFSAKLSVNMHNDVQATVFDSILRSDWMELSRFASGDLANRFSTDVNTVANCAVSWLPNLIIQLFSVISTLVVIWYYDPVMALIGCASTPLLFLMSRSLMRQQRDHNQNLRQVAGDMSAFQTETFRNVDTIKSFGVEEQTGRKLRFWQNNYKDAMLEYNRFSIRTNAWLTVMGTVVQYAAFGYCLWRLWRQDILFGTMTLFLQQRANLSAGFSALVSLVPTALSGSVAAERIRELMNLKKEDRTEAPAMPQGGCAVELRGVQAAYGSERKILENVDLDAPAGQVTALVGPSGEGKTTLLRLMLGLLPAQSGQMVLVDGSGERYPLGADSRHCFSYVPQGNTVIAGTVAENLRLGREDADEMELETALRDACAWEFVCQLPMGIHTPIGEGGKGLSEGQAQRLAIARALVRKAPVMLLDEVTSALDRQTEQRVLENLARSGVTTLVITHRMSVLSLCGGAYRVEGGRVQALTKEELEQLANQ